MPVRDTSLNVRRSFLPEEAVVLICSEAGFLFHGLLPGQACAKEEDHESADGDVSVYRIGFE